MRQIFIFIVLFSLGLLFACDREYPQPESITQIASVNGEIEYVLLSSTGNTIYYVLSDGMGNSELHAINTDGKNERRIFNAPGFMDRAPSVSQNGDYLSYVTEVNTDTGVNASLYLTHLTNMEHKLLYEANEYINTYSFINNDQQVLFNRHIMTDQCHCNTIWQISVDGSDLIQISGSNNAVVADLNENRNRFLVNSSSGTYIMNLSGEDITPLAEGISPVAFSPDEEYILGRENNRVYDEDVQRYISVVEAVLIKIDDNNKSYITDFDAQTYPIAFTPDGNKILISSNKDHEDEQKDLYLINKDGTEISRLTRNGISEYVIGFVKEGKELIYYTKENGTSNIFSMSI